MAHKSIKRIFNKATGLSSAVLSAPSVLRSRRRGAKADVKRLALKTSRESKVPRDPTKASGRTVIQADIKAQEARDEARRRREELKK